MVHASDIGTREVAYECIEAFADSDYTIGILDVCIPRAYCDMNRPRDKAILGTLDSDFWLPLYDRAQQEIEDSISRSRFCFQLHSMNNFDPLYDWKIES